MDCMIFCVIFVIQDAATVSEQQTTSVKDVGDTEEPVRCSVALLCIFGGDLFLLWQFLIPADYWLNLHFLSLHENKPYRVMR